MTRKATNKKSTITKQDVFETAMAIRMVFGEQPEEFKLEERRTFVRLTVFSLKSAEEALPYIQQTLDDFKCKAPVQIVVVLKLTAQSAESKTAEKPETQESPATPVQDKISEGLRAYLAEAAIPGDKGIDVSVHLSEQMTADQVNEKLEALFGTSGARVNDARPSSSTFVVRVKRGLIERFNKADWVTKVNRFYGEAQPLVCLC